MIKHNMYSLFKYDLQLRMILAILPLGYWIFILNYLYKKLNIKTNKKSCKYSFIPFFILIGIGPIIILLKHIFVIQTYKNKDKLLFKNPYFATCLSGPESLTEEEKKLDIVGKIDYKCLASQKQYNDAESNMLNNRAYGIIYSVFWLCMYFFTADAGKFKNTIERNNHFITHTIQQALFLSLIILSSVFMKNYLFISSYIFEFLTNVLVLVGALMTLLVTYILQRIVCFYI